MAKRGEPKFEVTFEIDANGIMNCTAKDVKTGKKKSIVIESSGGLSENDVERMIKDAERSKEKDAEAKKLIMMKNEADQMQYDIERQLEELGDKVPSDVVDKVKQKIQDLNLAIVTDDFAKIATACEDLKNEAMNIGKAMMNQQE